LFRLLFIQTKYGYPSVYKLLFSSVHIHDFANFIFYFAPGPSLVSEISAFLSPCSWFVILSNSCS
jgi:hypothetical protein